jgi:ParB/RepB/Spo0J family partition protein
MFFRKGDFIMTDENIQKIDVNKIVVSDCNVRRSDTNKGIDELAESIKEYDLLQPVVVYSEKGKYHLIVGQRRFRAIQKLLKAGYDKFKEIDARVLSNIKSDEQLKLLSLSENIHRVELNRSDIVEVISYFYNNHKKSVKEVARIIGKSSSYVSDHLKIQDAPKEILEMLDRKKITMQDVKRIMEIAPDDKEKMIRIAKKIKDLTPPEKVRLVKISKIKTSAKAGDLIKEAKELRIEEQIIVPLSLELMNALSKAMKDIGLSKEEIAAKALEDWLSSKGYFKG